ncbi:N-acetylmuramoyl-L-alanine amidase [Aetokthonos hydrillicola Thurmond2011]|jgi:hypothetical protein|uniref:N-acetylmuramoyl-L-alanine amidase n=1 Tax=Aetokthonos hydrillicola Thurmond2011 TaxID=2712845 RepID=A0AAP5IDD3_9CYAN|nr:peptidoglycan recognition family protein [Aetokthonos hydrillicola]MBO3459759.1 N-acetylmuramoyl-L-alanine amidase [Aetokthonos hydrillicola CCALA 1050]MBW4585192.1 N-acetylmuramoyl-L-alanine amidase [Aetokthonos hydrillicola CCALA 1050]MDR9899531.1 N-acetylmuramoyl-L-alanine amidase [Aetokthonos hydrillicola Thurmond2011]
MGTWILETDKAIYWMEEQYYIDKINKSPISNREYHAVVAEMKHWFNSQNPPGMMKVVLGDINEPEHKPVNHAHGSGHAKTPKIRFIPADESNYNSRNGTKIDMIVMHNTDASLQASIDTFKDPNANVSAHYIVARTGEIIQMVKDSFRAWHAGDRIVNSRSIGIEHEATNANRGMTPAQQQSSIALVKYLMEAYSIPATNIKPHRDVTSIPGGTDCPRWIWSTDTDFEDWKNNHLA